jgi:predicted transcriptional regulator
MATISARSMRDSAGRVLNLRPLPRRDDRRFGLTEPRVMLRRQSITGGRLRGHPRTFTISLQPKLARQVDRRAAAEGGTRSELFREAVRRIWLAGRDGDQIFTYGEGVAEQQAFSEADVDRAVANERRTSRR